MTVTLMVFSDGAAATVARRAGELVPGDPVAPVGAWPRQALGVCRDRGQR